MKYSMLAGAVALCLSSFQVLAESQAEDTPQKPPVVSTEDIVNILIQQGLIDEEKLAEIVKKAQDKTRAGFGGAVEVVEESKADTPQDVDSGVVRVPYVPDYIKEEIRDQVRMELREEVVGDVMSQAEKERWGVPGTTPDWTHKIKITGDIRLRGESSLFDDKNDNGLSLISYRDYNKVNDRGSLRLDSRDDVLNITEDRHRLRTRLRLGIKAEVTPGIKAEARLVTGNSSDPVSENQTLGNYGESFEISLDRANLQYKSYENDLKLVGGRFKNPFMHTDLVWDSDYHFDGVAASYWFNRGDSWDDDEIQFDPFITAGLFPLQEVDQDSSDKWLYGLQFGFDYTWWDQDKLSMALTYYHYENITGEYNSLNSTDKDHSAPEYVQKGNTLYNIRNVASGDAALLALLGEYRLLNLTTKYDIAAFAPHHVILTLDLVQNIALDRGEMSRRLLATGSSTAIGTGDADSESAANSLQERDLGVQFGVTFGWPIVAKRGDWQASLIIRHLERDAVLDAYADSDFHLGGTDGKGFILEGKYGITDETWLQMKWLSSEAVDGNDLGVDVYQVDVNARF
ncbi:MAG: putative porin [Pseudomonadales bacterium]|nr:putative porin [Pseudomonadales bacterium]